MFSGPHANTTRRQANHCWPVYFDCSEARIFSIVFRPISFHFASTNLLYDEIRFIRGIHVYQFPDVRVFMQMQMTWLFNACDVFYFNLRWVKLLSPLQAKLILHSSRRFGLQDFLEPVGVSLELLGTWLTLGCKMILNFQWKSGESKLIQFNLFICGIHFRSFYISQVYNEKIMNVFFKFCIVTNMLLMECSVFGEKKV